MENKEISQLLVAIFAVLLFAFILMIVFMHRHIRHVRTEQQRVFQAIYRSQIEEQKRIGSDLHDDVGPMIASIHNRIEQYRNQVSDVQKTDHLTTIQKELLYTGEQIRKASHSLIPVDFEEMSLEEAIEDAVSDLNRQHFKIYFNAESNTDHLKETEKSHLLKITKELVLNAIKHSQGNRAEIVLTSTPRNTTLEVSDNGMGLKKDIEGTGVGLKNIANRVSLMGGVLHYGTNTNGGLQITITLKT